MQHVTPEMEQVIRKTVLTTLSESPLVDQFIEEVIDRLEGVDDEALLRLMQEATGESVSMEEVYKALRE